VIGDEEGVGAIDQRAEAPKMLLIESFRGTERKPDTVSVRDA
jgi:hypothetical protein